LATPRTLLAITRWSAPLDAVDRAAERESTVLSNALVRPVVVAIAHLPIVIIAFCAAPLWLLGFLRPASHGEAAFRLLRELRTWSREVVHAAAEVRNR
jgi:ABC-type transport system involved in cytochrome c biogenesis permease subunit